MHQRNQILQVRNPILHQFRLLPLVQIIILKVTYNHHLLDLIKKSQF